MNEEELDKEIDEIVREAYRTVNQDYLREQAKIALKVRGYNPEEVDVWLNQAKIGVSGE